MTEKYYVAGCVDNGLDVDQVEDQDAEFWTLYERDASGESEALAYFADRRSAEAAMAVYVERDALSEQVRALAAENSAMKQIIDSVTDLSNEPEYHSDAMGCGLEDRRITDRYEAMSHGWECAMERVYGEVIPCAEELNFTATDAVLKEVGALAIDGLADAYAEKAGELKDAGLIAEANARERDVRAWAASFRAGGKP